jgi:hypothetical protein
MIFRQVPNTQSSTLPLHTKADLIDSHAFSVELCQIFDDQIVCRLQIRSRRSNFVFLRKYVRVNETIFRFGYVLRPAETRIDSKFPPKNCSFPLPFILLQVVEEVLNPPIFKCKQQNEADHANDYHRNEIQPDSIFFERVEALVAARSLQWTEESLNGADNVVTIQFSHFTDGFNSTYSSAFFKESALLVASVESLLQHVEVAHATSQ